MPGLREFVRVQLHRAALACGFSLRRVKPFERALLKYMLTVDDFWFVQVGAYNGITSDPFCKFIIDGSWQGVLVEPQRRYCDILSEIYHDRPQIICRNVAIGSNNGMKPLFRIADEATDVPYWAPQLASFHYQVVLGHRDRIPNIERWIISDEVECVTLATLVRQSQLPRVDLLAIDVEGSDFEIVQQIDSLSALPRFIYYEHLHLSDSDRLSSIDFLITRGYRLHAVNDGDTFAELIAPATRLAG